MSRMHKVTVCFCILVAVSMISARAPAADYTYEWYNNIYFFTYVDYGDPVCDQVSASIKALDGRIVAENALASPLASHERRNLTVSYISPLPQKQCSAILLHARCSFKDKDKNQVTRSKSEVVECSGGDVAILPEPREKPTEISISYWRR